MKTPTADSKQLINPIMSAAFVDAAGMHCEITLSTQNPHLALTPHVRQTGPGQWEMRLEAKNVSRKPIRLLELAPLNLSSAHGGELDLGGRPTEWTLLGQALGPTDGGVFDICMARGEALKHDFYIADYLVLGCRRTAAYLTAGFLGFARQHGAFRLKFEQDVYKFESFKAICECDGILLAPGKTIRSETLYVNTSPSPRKALAEYTALLANSRPKRFRSITGWGTWDYYHANLTEDDVLENARWLAGRRAEYPVEYIQIDHGFQRCEGDWLATNEKFPHGMKWLATRISELGFKPGIWLCPFLVDERSQVYKDHPDWVICNARKEPMRIGGYTKSDVFALDCSIPSARAWVRRLGRDIAAMGYRYVKLDGANLQPMAMGGVLADPGMTKIRAMRLGLEALRKGLGPDVILLNACLYGASLGLANAMRTGGDVGARWNSLHIDKHHGERDNYPGCGFILRTLLTQMNFDFQHRTWWINDPDYLVVRPKGDRSELSLQEARSWATVVGMTNGLLMISDRMSVLPEERLALVRKILPAWSAGSRTVDWMETAQPQILDLAVRNETDAWHVAAVINTRLPERTREYTLDFAALNLDKDREYHVFDFWAGKWLGRFRGSCVLGRIPARHCRVLCIRPAADVPQIVGTDMHYTQGGVEIRSSRYDAKRKRLIIRTRAAHKQGRIFVHVPDGLCLKRASKGVRKSVLEVPVTLTGREQSLTLEFI